MRLPILKELSLPPIVLVIAFAFAVWQIYQRAPNAPGHELTQVAERYVKAIYARDFAAAYRYLSARDRDTKSETTYVDEQGAFSGFTLQLARKLAGAIEVSALPAKINGDKAALEAHLKLPDPDKLAPLLLQWNEEQLNALSAAEQTALLSDIDERIRQKAIPFTSAKESFDFVKENNQWKIFLNWQSPVRVAVKINLPSGTPLQIEPPDREITFKPGEPFTISLKLQNASNRELRARVMHNVEPKTVEKFLGVGDCGTFVPFRLGAGKADQNNATFLVWTNLPAEIKRFTMIYDFEVDKQSP